MEHDVKLKVKQTRFFCFSFDFSFLYGLAQEAEADTTKGDPNEP